MSLRTARQRRRIDGAGERFQLTHRIDAIGQRRRRVGAVEQVADAVEHVAAAVPIGLSALTTA
jgi:hypothetical protein